MKEEIKFLKNCIEDYKEEILFAEYAGDREAAEHYKSKIKEVEQKIKAMEK